MAMTGQRHRGDRPWLVHVPFAVIMLLLAAAVVRALQYHWREGAVLVGVALFVAGALRAVLPEERAGLLAIRGKVVDILTYSALCAAVLYIALSIVGGPFDASS
ncbi:MULTISPECIES: DUF3017 domain-containing protein [Amycolatopsis]|uniref:DUF3017 domain-containing protein n=1 Tax=Amycolatopsis dendrobii TaxID=2760662 RepID=A0A7W3ZE92_9PSEU|nr:MULTISPECIES: DUF3017 domain-containing protein [Amycolatopsis]MBB1157753.1 DUF3017 domain-containing protein [Amycolatopsis dendrobii]UKD54065.1 DUF3017 domain-containing protein [Amycolatopsis sp. FU40]